MKIKQVGKLTFQEIRQQAKTPDGQIITRQLIAKKAELTYAEVYLVDIGGHLSSAKVRKVLWAFNELSGSKLTLQDIKRGG